MNKSSLAAKQPVKPAKAKKPKLKTFTEIIQSKRLHRQEFKDYRQFIQKHYDGFAGHLTGLTGFVTGHEALAGRLIGPKNFDLKGCKRILDAACGNGRYSRFLVRHADPDAFITGFDLSQTMLKRAQQRPEGQRVSHVAADMTRLPYADGTFDAAVMGWALEHLPDARLGLREMARVLRPGGKFLLLVTEDTITGSMCSRMWHCRTYNRQELQQICHECGLQWDRQMWFSRLHRIFRLGGIIVELKKV